MRGQSVEGRGERVTCVVVPIDDAIVASVSPLAGSEAGAIDHSAQAAPQSASPSALSVSRPGLCRFSVSDNGAVLVAC